MTTTGPVATEGTVKIFVDGAERCVEPGITVAAALMNAGVSAFRRSVTGEARAPLCGMGICHECCAMVDGVAHRRTCLVTVAEGMQVVTRGGAA